MTSNAVAAVASTLPICDGKNELTELEYARKFCQLPQETPAVPGSPQKPKRSATADKKEKAIANRKIS